MKNPNYIKSTTLKFAIKGKLSEDGSFITYINSDKEEFDMDVVDCFAPFKGKDLELVLTEKTTEELSPLNEEEF